MIHVILHVISTVLTVSFFIRYDGYMYTLVWWVHYTQLGLACKGVKSKHCLILFMSVSVLLISVCVFTCTSVYKHVIVAFSWKHLIITSCLCVLGKIRNLYM